MGFRNVFGIAVAAFVIVGAVGWLGNMPKPAPADVATLTAAQSAGVVALPGDPEADATGDGAEAASASSASSLASKTDGVVSGTWLVATATATGIPPRVLQAYAAAAVVTATANPSCGVSWNTIAAIGMIESGNGTHDGAHIGPSGQLVGSIIGPALDGTAYAAAPDTDDGAWDGDKKWDRAVGPLQFLPSSWATSGVDGNGDGKADPNQIDDAALTAAQYLCAAGGQLTTPDGWTLAVLAYNHDDDYVDRVRTQANDYAREAG
ncbi:MAG TPA: lytic transglycosylase domain-containing protein [Lacisediminihabitans sp.]|uniref:lytic transglycosylase domain-containing protein n=1 Tax=Lacisediminihabitans sp. TaxID=2787631 RepID=UPI002ED824DF